ncbi:MAG: hypothetical protein WCJ87_13115 [Burkholderiales bacterium]
MVAIVKSLTDREQAAHGAGNSETQRINTCQLRTSSERKSQAVDFIEKTNHKLMDFPTRFKRQAVARTDAAQAESALWASRNETAVSRRLCLATILSLSRVAALA